MVFSINGVKLYIYNTYPYFDICFTEENAEKFARQQSIFPDFGNMHHRAMVKMTMYIYFTKFGLNNNWRKMHGFVKINKKVMRKRQKEVKA